MWTLLLVHRDLVQYNSCSLYSWWNRGYYQRYCCGIVWRGRTKLFYLELVGKRFIAKLTLKPTFWFWSNAIKTTTNYCAKGSGSQQIREALVKTQQVSARKKLKKIATKKFQQIWVLIALLDSLGQKTKNFNDVFQRKVVSKWSKNDLSSELFFSEFFHWTPPIFFKNLKALETSFSKLVLHAQKVQILRDLCFIKVSLWKSKIWLLIEKVKFSKIFKL